MEGATTTLHYYLHVSMIDLILTVIFFGCIFAAIYIVRTGYDNDSNATLLETITLIFIVGLITLFSNTINVDDE